MGARFRLAGKLPAAVLRHGEPVLPGRQAVLMAMKPYGLILADNGSNWYFQGSAVPLARRAGRPAQADPGRGVPGGRRVLPDGEPELRDRPGPGEDAQPAERPRRG